MNPLMIVGVAVGAWLLLTGKAQALIGGGANVLDLVNRHEGKRVIDVPSEDREILRQRAESLLAPAPPKSGSFGGAFLVPGPGSMPDPGCDNGACILVRRTAQRSDLAYLYDRAIWFGNDPNWILYKKSYAKGQEDWSAGGELGRIAKNPIVKGVVAIGGAVAAPVTGGASVVAAGAVVSRK